MSADAIFNVTRAIAGRLDKALTASGVPGGVFVGPLDDPDSSGAALILFLYRMVPNPSLRNSEHRVFDGSTPPKPITHKDSLPLDLYYLVTVGTRVGQSEEPMLRALGYAIQELQGLPELSGPTLGEDVVHVSLEPLTTEEVSRVWALFPAANYRTSAAYLVSPVWIDPARPPLPVANVVDDGLRSAPGAMAGHA